MALLAPSGIMNRRGFRSSSVAAYPIPQASLALWLKADAGVTTTQETFISQIIVSGAGTTTSNGTYTRASGGFEQFTGPNDS
jgi:hypothetical protein